MKTLFTFCFLLVCGVCFGQQADTAIYTTIVDFDHSNSNHLPISRFGLHVWRDTIRNPNSSWQVGKSHKSGINNSISAPNILITDTLNAYPSNDTSSVIFSVVGCGSCGFQRLGLAGYYNVISDSLKDYGTIEVSTDSGKHWLNLMTDTTYTAHYKWLYPKPVLTGNSGGWKRFWIELGGLVTPFPAATPFDIYIKFTFLTDSIPNNLEGLAIDEIGYYSVSEGIPQIQNNALLSLYPNPVTDFLYIERKGTISKGQLQILDGMGQVVFEDRNFTAPSISTKALGLPAGLYFLHFTSGDTYAVQKFLVQP